MQLRITIASDGAGFDPNGAAVLEDADGNSYSPTTADLTGCPAFGASQPAPGTTALGCLTFELPIDARVTEMIFTPRGEFGSVSAEWVIP